QNEGLLYNLAYLYSKNNQPAKAKNIVVRLVEMFPNNTNYRAFLNQLSTVK
ncbi:MAG TPA: tetratricopeptide repeat protein, partial [Mariniflexile sp.]|nr:tetratricopeptide repeat protein [Mariniflexile sp.]